MSKELLKALVDVLDDLKLRKNLNEDDALNISESVLVRAEKAIENYLTQPEQDPLSDDEIYMGFQLSEITDISLRSFLIGVRFAEKAHGIGVE